ncbi:MAG TPA: xylanase [Planctomycetaceae bacterium]|nr:xylanase [Planctomycetaceae bacterium]
MTYRLASAFLSVALCFSSVKISRSNEPINVWPDLAPGETTRLIGEALPAKPEEVPTVTRVVNITRPTFTVHQPKKPNGTAVIILPGGGFTKVVPDKEGTEAAQWLSDHGITAFVLSYRTTQDAETPGWIKPLQDIQRTIALVRSQADHWQVQPNRIGIVAFSAGGHVGARLLCDGGKLSYKAIDGIDAVSHRPDFAVLVYPWNIYDDKTAGLVDGVEVPEDCPPTFLVHTHDDRSSSLGAVMFYVGLKQHGIPSELHIYGNGGHGYGIRPVAGSQISSWTDHATHWFRTQRLIGD